MSDIEIVEKRSLTSIIVGLFFICMSLASLLTLRGLSRIPEYVTFNLIGRDLIIDIHELIYLLATPSLYAASIWGEESMVMSVAFLFLGLGLSFIFRKSIKSRMRRG